MTTKSKAKDAVKTVLTGMLGRTIDAMSKTNYEADTIVGEFIAGELDTVSAVNEALEAAVEAPGFDPIPAPVSILALAVALAARRRE